MWSGFGTQLAYQGPSPPQLSQYMSSHRVYSLVESAIVIYVGINSNKSENAHINNLGARSGIQGFCLANRGKSKGASSAVNFLS